MYQPLRNADLATLGAMLQDQSARRLDLVAPASAIHPVVTATNEFALYVDQVEVVGMQADGEPVVNIGDPLLIKVGDVMLEGIATRLGIPMRYTRRMLAEHVSLLAQNVQGWLDHMPDEMHMLRTFQTDEVGAAFGRAFLSPRFECIDNFDVLLGLLDGVRTACPDAVFDHADLNDRGMRLRISAPNIARNVSHLLGDYTPIMGRSVTDFPLIWAGLYVQNSETGDGAYSIGPRAVVEVCKNGMTRAVDAVRRVHLGARLNEGTINWSDETRRTQVELIRTMTSDAVTTFLSDEYLDRFVADMTSAANLAVSSTQAIQVVENVTQAGTYSDAEASLIMNTWIAQSQRSSALDLANALTHAAQLMSAEVAADLEEHALHYATAAVHALV